MGVPACTPEYPGAGRSGMLRRTRPVPGVSELYPVRPGATPWKAKDDGREGGILPQRGLSAPRIQAGDGWLPPLRLRGSAPQARTKAKGVVNDNEWVVRKRVRR